MLTIAKLIIIAAFLTGAFLASLDEDAVNWTYFIPVIFGGIIGITLLKVGEKAAAQDDSLLAADKEMLEVSLQNILKNLRDLDGRKEKIPTYEMRFEIDKIFRTDLNNFADSRESMKHLFGLMAYADIMSSFAAGERYLNRVWSASTDGYVDEVLAYVSKSHSQFEHALEEWQRYESKG
ncbi:hypothetical protein QGN29_06175 [Temperatibacter marinus]|uniref:Uncharacterized protein n=1 Tax=Temperatibacter marinus TaxID=1456591 RepID=A0AA52EKL3_9PROT|nr:hypothetical protein [Temperatibacter marinus]WND03959.1 hypothetical protein QGN29_06175 [Temperatibacter marinus]